MKKLLVALAALAFAATACPVDPPAGTNYAQCPTAGAGQVQVAVVTEGVPATSPQVVCVVVANGANGITALNARAARIGTEAPRIQHFSFGDLVCAIDGAPVAPDCGTTAGYWHYSEGGASWTSSLAGASARVLHQGDVDGWNFLPDFGEAVPTHSSSFAVLTA
ncbi:MAG: hypothetical protein U0Q22_01260 [Acidimicrobiales bacterium]